MQRCVFHVFRQVRAQTASRPKLQAGAELYGLAKELLAVREVMQAHERLVTARNGLDRLVSKSLLFTFLDPELTGDGTLPSTNNKIEGGVNAQLRRMLQGHRGLSAMRRAKAVFWWCYMHTESPLPAAEILKVMPTDADIEEVYRQAVYEPQGREGSSEWGDGLAWAELRHALSWRHDWD